MTSHDVHNYIKHTSISIPGMASNVQVDAYCILNLYIKPTNVVIFHTQPNFGGFFLYAHSGMTESKTSTNKVNEARNSQIGRKCVYH